MFSFPVTVPVRSNEAVYPMDVTIAIDDIACVKSLLDKGDGFGVESSSSDLVPATEIVFVDGRKLPVLETPATINRYLDAYCTFDEFYTKAGAAEVEEERRDNVVPLFKASSCDTSEGSTPA